MNLIDIAKLTAAKRVEVIGDCVLIQGDCLVECDSTHFDTARRRLCAELSKPRLPFAEFEPSNKTASMFDGDAA